MATQAAILDTAARLLKAGGRMVYSTCTIEPEENQLQIRAFLQRHPEFCMAEPAVAFPAGMTVTEYGALSVPTRTGMDGFSFVRCKNALRGAMPPCTGSY